MTYSWASRDRLCPMRMVWLDYNYNEPKYELVRMERKGKGLRASTRLDWMRESRIERHHWVLKSFAGRLGEWPLWRPDHRKPVKKAKRHRL